MTIKHKHALNSLIKFLRPLKKTVLLIAAVVAITILITTLPAIWLSRRTDLEVPSLGTIKTLGVEAYWDRNLENKTEAIHWGTVWVGSSQNISFFVRSISNYIAKLTLNTTTWNPANISDYMNLTWNYNGTPINPGEVIQVTLTLSASSSISFIRYLITNDVREFSFDIIICTSEYSSNPSQSSNPCAFS